MQNKQRCFRYHEPKENACNTKIHSSNFSPANRDLWFKNKLPSGLDPVLSNICNGGWLCNFDPQQQENSKLCNRSFFNGVSPNPCNMGSMVDVESKIKNINKKYNKFNCNK